MDKTFRLGLVVGRFQHFHIGHEKMVNTALAVCDKVLLLVGSSQESYTERNPYNLKVRLDVIKEVYQREINSGELLIGHIDDMTHENDISHEWGDFVLSKVDMWVQHYGLSEKVDCMVYGDDEDRMEWFRPESVEDISQIVISRKKLSISATEMRELLVNNDIDEWYSNMPAILNASTANWEEDYWFTTLREELLHVPCYKGEID